MLSKNSSLTVRPLELADFEVFEAIDLQAHDLIDMKKIFKDSGMPAHQAIALNAENKPVLMFGFYEVSPKVFEVWTIFGKNWSPRLYPSSVDWLDGYLCLLDFDRVQHILLANRTWMKRVLEYMGFEQEAYLKKYVSGNDCYIYARFK